MARIPRRLIAIGGSVWLASACGSSVPPSPAIFPAPASIAAATTPSTAVSSRPTGTSGSAVPSPSSSSSSSSSPLPSSPSVAPSSSLAPADARRADLAHLVERLKAVHPNPFLDEGEAGFMARVASISADAGTMTNADFLVAVMGLMGHRDRDGHSGAWALAQPGSLLHAWPVWLWDFPDGLRIVAARGSSVDLVGARVTMVGHVPIAVARRTVEPLVPRDNRSSLRANLPTYLTLPEVLESLGILRPGDPALTLELADGSTRMVTPEPLEIESFRDWIFGVYRGQYPAGLPPDDDGPAYLRHRDLAFWSEPLGERGLYVGYNAVTRTSSANGLSIGGLAASVTSASEASPARPIVIDLRNNPGGDNNTYGQLLDAVEAAAKAHPGSVSLITGRGTFSAAGNFVTDLMTGDQRAGIHLVGEPPGGGLDIYGDVVPVTLPNSKIVVLVSARYHERAPGDPRLELTPDVPVEVTWADHAARRDPVLEAALRR